MKNILLSNRGLAAAFCGCGLLLSQNAAALNFEFGDVQANVNTLLTAGVSWRAQDRDYSIISKRSNPSQHGLGAGDEVLCADPSTGGDPNQEGGASEDLLGGCVLSGKEHHDFVTSPGGFSQNEDQGNLNYDKGDIVHAALKATVDFDVSWGDFGLFARAITFWDPTASDFDEMHFDALHQRGATLRSAAVEDEVAFSTALEDFYVYGSFDMFDRTLSVNVGKQNISWGESLTLVVNSVNSVNAPNVIRLNTPGFALKELFIPTNAVLAGIDLSENTSMEAFYQLGWDPVQLPPIGDFFSPSDFAGTGNGYANLLFGREPEDPGNLQDQYIPGSADHTAALGRGCINDGTNFGDDVTVYDRQNRDAFGNSANPDSQIDERIAEFGYYQAEREGSEEGGRVVCAAQSREPDSSGQWGVKFAYYAGWLNDTEFGFYYTNTHSRLPMASGIAGDINDDASGHNLHGLLSTAFALGAQPDGSLEEDDADVLGTLKRADTAAIFLDYPEDIEMYGMSFNTTFGDLSVSGEVAYRPNLPVQIAAVDVILAALGPTLGQARDSAGPSYLEAYRFGSQLRPEDQAEYDAARASGASNYDAYWGLNNSRGPSGAYISNRNGSTRIGTSQYVAGEIIRGYERLEVANVSTTLLYVMSQNPFGADQIIMIGDFGTTQVLNMPSLGELQFAAPGDDNWYGPGREEIDSVNTGNGGVPCTEVTNVLTNLVGVDGAATPIDTVVGLVGGLVNANDPLLNTDCVPGLLRQTPVSEPGSTFATSSSWGFRALAFLKYNNLIFGANLNQLLGVYVDVNGNSPSPAGNFVEGRKRFVWGSEFQRGDWTMNFNYNWFTGAGDRNPENDRDNYGIDIRYSF